MLQLSNYNNNSKPFRIQNFDLFLLSVYFFLNNGN